MNWPWVSRARLSEAERFWTEMADRSDATATKCLNLYTEMTDRYCAAIQMGRGIPNDKTMMDAIHDLARKEGILFPAQVQAALVMYLESKGYVLDKDQTP